MKILCLFVITFYSFIPLHSNLKRYSSGKRFDQNNYFLKSDTSFIDTLGTIRTVNDLIKRMHFKGIITVNGKVLNDDDTFLNRTAQENHIKKITVMTKLPIDSIKKYGQKTKSGMIIIITK